MKLNKFVLAAAALVASAGSQAVTSVGGIDFDDNAFADALYYSAGDYTTSGGSLASVLTDKDAGTYAFSFTPGANVLLGFTDNGVYNLDGADLAIFELGVPDSVKVNIGFTTMSYTTVATGYTAGGFSLNVALIDFSDFGVAAGSNLTAQAIGLDIVAPEGTVPSLSLVGALHVSAIPEAETYAMMLVGLAGLGLRLNARRRREA